jgi:two-component system response regulator AtoC
MIKVLVVDDEESLRKVLKKELSRKGFYVEVAQDGEEGLRFLRNEAFDVVLLDIVMPGMTGIEFMKEVKKDPLAPSIIVLTGKATVENAVLAMKSGAFDYITKPYKLDELEVLIKKAFEYRSLKIKSELLEKELVKKELPELVFSSEEMKKIIDLVKKIAPTDSPVLIQGESGTGKEVIAKTIWYHSKRKGLPFFGLNCATFSENLIESELFGHERGAFTSAYQTKLGIVEVANKGTLFLDEIGEMPVSLQAKLLRFLDSGEFRRVGGTKNLKSDVRIIAATNRDLSELVRKGEFRQDLFYRLNVINIYLPPLRDRRDDIPTLAEYFLRKFSMKLSKSLKGFTQDAMEALLIYDWPGNVRELENVIERAVILSEGEEITRDLLSLPATDNKKYKVQTPGETSENVYDLNEMERLHILRVLQEVRGNRSVASKLLGIDRKTLYLKLKKYGIE